MNAPTGQHALATDAVRKPVPATCGGRVTNPHIAWAIKNHAATAVRQHGTVALGAPALNPPVALALSRNVAGIAAIGLALAVHGRLAQHQAVYAALVPPPASVVLQEVGVVLKPEHAAPVAHGVHTEAVLQADIANAV